MSQEILYEVKDGMGRITFNRPEARNAFTFRMYERLAEICQEASADSSVKVLVLTGANEKAFAAGTDISEFRKFSTAKDTLDYEVRINALARRFGASPESHHRRHRRGLHGRRRHDCRVLRHSYRRGQRPLRRADCPHARQLPVDGELRQAGGLAGAGARKGNHLHRPPDRCRAKRARSDC